MDISSPCPARYSLAQLEAQELDFAFIWYRFLFAAPILLYHGDSQELLDQR